VLRYLVGLRGDWDAVVPRVDGFLQPLHAVYHRRLAAHLATLLVAGGGQLKELLTRPELRVRLVEEAELRPLEPRLTSFMNLGALQVAVVLAAGGQGAAGRASGRRAGGLTSQSAGGERSNHQHAQVGVGGGPDQPLEVLGAAAGTGERRAGIQGVAVGLQRL